MPVTALNKQTANKNPFGVTTDKFWNFIPATNEKPPELLLYGAISSQQSWWEDRVTPQQFNQELASIGDVPEIVVRINSGGGDVFAANAIYTRLKDHSAKITVKIDGWAASAATIIAMAGDTIMIARNGVFMIHDPAMTVWDTFKAEDFMKMAEELKVIKQSIINSYVMKTGRTEQDISNFMSEEKWWTGDDAVQNGFCDELMFEESKTVVENASKIIVNSITLDISGFKTIPKQLLDSSLYKDHFTNNKNNQIPTNKEEKVVADNIAITTVEALERAYPDLVASVRNTATDAERARIKSISDMALDGFEDIISAAMYDKPTNAETVAIQIINEQKKQGGTYLDNREKDVEASGIKKVNATAAVQGNEATDIFDAAIDKMLPEK